jgi:cell division protein ZapB
MVNELNALENKIALVASLCRTLRTENMQLRQQLAAAEDDRKVFAERMESARSRLEQLAEQLPEAKATV